MLIDFRYLDSFFFFSSMEEVVLELHLCLLPSGCGGKSAFTTV